MSHDVRIDAEGIAAAFDAAAAGQPVAGPVVAASPLDPGPPASDAWRPVTTLAASLLSNKVCPAWEVPPDVREQWADALGECLNQLMPGGLGNIDAWGPWGKLAFASGVWLMAGFDPDTMTLKPRYPVDPDAPTDRPPQPGSFTTDA